jgi:hypothetical protein
MSEWVVIDITSFTKTTTADKVKKILKTVRLTLPHGIIFKMPMSSPTMFYYKDSEIYSLLKIGLKMVRFLLFSRLLLRWQGSPASQDY